MDKKESTELMLQIAIGDFDEDLDRIVDAVVARRRLVTAGKAAETLATLVVNDVVRFVDKMTPQYLAGARACVVGFDGDKVKLRLLESRYRGSKGYGFGSKLNAPASILVPTGNTYDSTAF